MDGNVSRQAGDWLGEALLTVAEAAYVSGLSVRAVNHELDERIIRNSGPNGSRRIAGADLLYLGALRNLQNQIGKPLRRRLRAAIVEADRENQSTAAVEAIEIGLEALRRRLREAADRLESVTRDHITCTPGVVGGRPRIVGRRIPVQFIVDVMKSGADYKEMLTEYELSREQVDAALLYHRVSPKAGRPARLHQG